MDCWEKINLLAYPNLKKTFSIGPFNPYKSGMLGKILKAKPARMDQSLVSAPFMIKSILFKVIN